MVRMDLLSIPAIPRDSTLPHGDAILHRKRRAVASFFRRTQGKAGDRFSLPINISTTSLSIRVTGRLFMRPDLDPRFGVLTIVASVGSAFRDSISNGRTV